jgi:hypothetical protein
MIPPKPGSLTQLSGFDYNAHRDSDATYWPT